MATREQDHLLAIYLNDHLAGATAGVELIGRLSRTDGELSGLAAEIRDDRGALLRAMGRLGIRPNQLKIAAGWVAEKAGRLKPNGSVLRRSPLSTVSEVEVMMLGVRGKAAGWRTLHAIAEHDDRLDADEFTQLMASADDQLEVLESFRVAAVAQALAAPAGKSDVDEST
ncbi:MAG TPA: hypothetical protein VHV74_11215 [Pseudonocardiaceae bacterium]|nr:hypothetical protein [Pseudonocardiaceae bacterium]